MATKTTADVQRVLIAKGYDLGKGGPSGKGDDNIPGTFTRNALKLYQIVQNIPPTGMIDAATLDAMFPDTRLGGAIIPMLPWMDVARSLKGTTEIVGPKHNSTIMGLAKKLGLWYPSDETAWCGLFIAHCMSTALPNEPQPSNPLGARTWQNFGVALKTPALGAVMVFWRGSRTGWEGHVGLYLGERRRDGALRILGGNQGNSVSEAWLDSARLLAIRWPKSYALPTGGRVQLADSGTPLSTNEA